MSLSFLHWFGRPRWGRSIEFWLKLGFLLYRIVNPVVMSLLFVSTIVPVGVALRLFGKDPLGLKPRPNAASYWIERETPGPPPEAMKNQF